MKTHHDRHDRRLAVLVALAALTLSLPAASPAASEPQGSISVTLTGSGRVQSSPGGIDCGSTCKASFPLGSAVRLSAVPASGFYLTAWSGGCVGGSQSCEATADEDTQVQAQFAAGSAPTPPVHALTVSYSGEGRVTSADPGVIDCGTNCWTSFSGGGHVTLNAAPASGFVFNGWEGACSGTGSCDVAVTGLRSVIAVFRRQNTHPGSNSQLTINNSSLGTGHGQGTIHISWPGGSKDCDEAEGDPCEVNNVPNGMKVTIQPRPGPDTVVNDYGGYCQGTAQLCVVVLGQDEGVTTTFQDAEGLTTSYGLNLTRSGGGSVKSVPPGIDCGGDAGCRAAFKRTITVKLTPNVASGYTFGGWSGDCSGTGSCTVSMTVSRTVSAAFRGQRDQVRVTKSGRGMGTITTEPGGIQCGDTCTYSFRRGSSVTLRATPNGRSRFRAWGGACTGTSPCSLTISAAVDVSAAFDRCAASEFSRFTASATRKAVTVRVSLADRATARVRLLRGRATLATRTFSNLSAGAKSLRVPIRRGAAGKAKVELRLKDICGRTRTLSRSVSVK
jgi:type 1 fimbria pilin